MLRHRSLAPFFVGWAPDQVRYLVEYRPTTSEYVPLIRGATDLECAAAICESHTRLGGSKMLGRFFNAIVLVTILSGTAQAVLIIPIDPPPPPPPPVPAVSLIGLNPISSDPGVFATGPTYVLGIETSPFSVSTIGTVVGEMLSGLDLQPGTGQLLASSGQNGANPGHLFTVNSNTGAATLVGAIEILGINAPVGVPGRAFDQDGTLYGGTTSPSPGAPPMLITIDPVTGAGTVVGSYGSLCNMES